MIFSVVHQPNPIPGRIHIKHRRNAIIIRIRIRIINLISNGMLGLLLGFQIGISCTTSTRKLPGGILIRSSQYDWTAFPFRTSFRYLISAYLTEAAAAWLQPPKQTHDNLKERCGWASIGMSFLLEWFNGGQTRNNMGLPPCGITFCSRSGLCALLSRQSFFLFSLRFHIFRSTTKIM